MNYVAWKLEMVLELHDLHKVNELVINCNIMIALVYGSYNVLRREFNMMGLLMLCHV